MEDIQKIRYLSKSERETIEKFFKSWRLYSVDICDDFNPHEEKTTEDLTKFVVETKESSKVKVRVSFMQREEILNASLNKTGEHTWEMTDEDNKVDLSKWPGEEWDMNVELSIDPFFVGIPGLKEYLKERYSSPLPSEELINDNLVRALNAIWGISIAGEVFQNFFDSFKEKVNGDMVKETMEQLRSLLKMKEDRPKYLPLIEKLEQLDAAKGIPGQTCQK